MTRELVEIQPTELKFTCGDSDDGFHCLVSEVVPPVYDPVELKKQSSCSVQMVNTSDQYVAYKVKTTNPKRYCVRPNIGIISPKSPCEIIVTMQALRNPPADVQCRDKFLIQSTVVKEGTMTEDISPDLFAKENGKVVEEKKLKVALISAPHSSAFQSIDNVITQEPVYEAHSPVLQPLNGGENQEPVYEAHSPVLRPIDGGKKQEPVYEDRSPVFQPLDGLIKDKPVYEASKPREQVHHSTENIPVPSQTVAKDVEDLKAKLNEAEKIIARLREERTAIIQQQDTVQQELAVARRRRMAQIRERRHVRQSQHRLLVTALFRSGFLAPPPPLLFYSSGCGVTDEKKFTRRKKDHSEFGGCSLLLHGLAFSVSI